MTEVPGAMHLTEPSGLPFCITVEDLLSLGRFGDMGSVHNIWGLVQDLHPTGEDSSPVSNLVRR